MTKRWITLFLAVSAFGVAACGSDGDGASSPSSDSTLPAVDTSEPAAGYTHPTGADEVIISYAELGGFLPRELAFRQPPSIVISGDGQVFTPGAQIEIYPGPLLPAVQVQTITEAGIQDLLAAADEAGLLADVDYTTDTLVADAPTATVTISANGETWVHEAYALSIDGPDATDPMPERQALSDFITRLLTIGDTAGGDDVISEAVLFEPTDYEILAIAVDDLSAYGTDGIEPTVEEWPTDVSVRLTDASECTLVSASEVGEPLATANQLTFFSEDGVTYQVLARPALPGQTC